MVAFQTFKHSYMPQVPWKANCGEYVCAKNLGAQPPLGGCDSQLNSPYTAENYGEKATKKVGP